MTKGSELPVQQDGGNICAKGISGLARDRVNCVGEFFKGAEIGNPFSSGLLPHTGHRWKIVTWISAKRRKIRVLRWG